MPNLDELKRLVDQMPDPDGNGHYTENMDKRAIETAAAAIAKGGRENLLALIGMLGEPGTPADVKPRFALHCAVNYALVAGDEPLRRELCATMAGEVENPQRSAYVREYLCQELQWAGRDEACAALGRILLDEALTDAAATALEAIGGERAAAPLRAAAAKAQGKCRLNVIDALAALDDPRAAELFQSALADGDREVRIAAAVGLARLGRQDSAERLLAAADAATGWERIQLTKACLLLAERLAQAGKKPAARQIYQRLQETRTAANESHVREAARRSLAAIG